MIVTGRFGQACDEAADGSSKATTVAAKTALQTQAMKICPVLEDCAR
jgi:hypothetical protein